MQSDNPAFLPIGTEVSAKFNGAFCEAVIDRLAKNIRIKVKLQNPTGVVVVTDDELTAKNGKLEVNEPIEFIQQGRKMKGVIQNVKDFSKYHVVFDDGDEKDVKRTQIRLKGAKHFESDVSLNAMPLYNPDHFSKNVKIARTRKLEEREKRAASCVTIADEEDQTDKNDTSTEVEIKKESSEEPEEMILDKPVDSPASLPSHVQIPNLNSPIVPSNPDHFAVGSCVVVFYDTQAAAKIRNCVATSSTGISLIQNPVPSSIYPMFYEKKWYPAVVVSKLAYRRYEDENEVADENEITVRRFSNGQYLMKNVARMVPFSWLPSFSRKKMTELSESWSEEKDDVNFADAMDFAYEYIADGNLPEGWTTKEIEGIGSSPRKKTKKEAVEVRKEPQPEDLEVEQMDVEQRSDSDSSESQSSDEYEGNGEGSAMGTDRDMFIAKVYKYHNERSSSTNKTPIIAGKAIDLFDLHQLVLEYGGIRTVTIENKWINILRNMSLHRNPGATSAAVKSTYNKYLEPFLTYEAKHGRYYNDLVGSPRNRREGSSASSGKKKKTKKQTNSSRSSRETSVKSRKSTASTSSFRQRNESFGSDYSGKTDYGWSQQSNEGSVRSGSITKKYPGKKRRSAVDTEEAKELYQLCNCLSNFEIGQSVLAYHDGKWYDARVVEAKQPPLDELLKILIYGEDIDSLTDEEDEKLLKIMNKYSVTVHYTGWNSRYDETVKTRRLMVLKKDQANARKMLLTHLEGRRLTPTKIALAEWSTSGMDREDEVEFGKFLQEVEMVAVKVREEEEGRKENMKRGSAKQERKDSTRDDRLSPVPGSVKPTKDPIPPVLSFDSPVPSTSTKPPAENKSSPTVLTPKNPRYNLNPPPLPGRNRPKVPAPISSGPLLSTPEMAPKLPIMKSGPLTPNTPSYDYETRPPVLKVESGPLEKLVEAAKTPTASKLTASPAPEGEKSTKPMMVKAIALDCSGPIVLSSSPAKYATSSALSAKGDHKRKLSNDEDDQKEVKERKLMKPSNSRSPPKLEDVAMEEENVVENRKMSEDSKPQVKIEEKQTSDLPPVIDREGNCFSPVFNTPTTTDSIHKTPNSSTGYSRTTPPVGRGSGSGRKRGGRRGGRLSHNSDRRSSTNTSLKMMEPSISENFNHDIRFSDVGGSEDSGRLQDTFQNMKNKMYWEMKEENSLKDDTLLGLPSLDELIQNTAPEDLTEALEQRCAVLREKYTDSKTSVIRMEKKKRQHEIGKLTGFKGGRKSDSHASSSNNPHLDSSSNNMNEKGEKIPKRGSEEKRQRGRKRKIMPVGSAV